ncbi:MAG TPA: pilus assembly protein TadG-related protein [Pyrinomonadaceae bacterium]|jgi:Flp pilus assembly protein TadG|nr:pilus assembly protein TadG-related protein [Pyrinomonadaceae bacterium]
MNRLAERKNRKGERGSVLAMTALSMLSMLLAAGLAIDISHFYTAKAELQNAADAAALAAASQLNSSSGGIQLAVTEATKSLNNYDFSNPVTITGANVTFSNNLNGTYVDSATAQGSATTMRFAKVTLSPKPVDATLLAIVIARTQNLTATATAGMSVGLTMNKFYTAFAFIESTSLPLVRGNTYTLDAKAYNDSGAGSYRVLAGPDGDLILTGQIHAYGYIGSDYNVAVLSATSPSGNLSAPSMCRYAQIGTNTRFGDYSVHPGANATDEPPDTIVQENITVDQYRTMQGAGTIQPVTGVSSAMQMKNRRIMTLPIALNTDYNVSARTVNANRLGAFFIKRKVGTDCRLEVEYIGAPLAVPEGTYTPGSPQMSELTIPVLYK